MNLQIKSCVTPLIATITLLVGFMSQASAQLMLDQLSACSQINNIAQALSSNTNYACREPVTPLERAIVARAGRSADEMCFQGQSSQTVIPGFSCLRPRLGNRSVMECFRHSNPSVIDDYKASPPQYAVAAYLKDADKCAAQTPDTSVAWAGLFPKMMTLIAKPEFGFASVITRSGRSPVLAYHGYGAVDPSVEGASSRAIETFQVYLGGEIGSYVRPGITTTVGNWTLQVERDSESMRAFFRQIRSQIKEFTGKEINFSLYRNTPPNLNHAEKTALLDSFQNEISDVLSYEGLRRIEDSEMKNRAGFEGRTLVEIARNNASYGIRHANLFGEYKVAAFLSDKRRPVCVKDDGAVMVFMMTEQPIHNIGSSYGSVALLVLGFGTCGEPSKPRVQAFLNDLTQTLLDDSLQYFKAK